MMEFENGAYGTISCNRFSPAVNQATELCGTEGTIFTATDATNPFQSWPMAVYTNKEYTVETLPKILKDYRWPQLFWVEDIIDEERAEALGAHLPAALAEQLRPDDRALPRLHRQRQGAAGERRGRGAGHRGHVRGAEEHDRPAAGSTCP